MSEIIKSGKRDLQEIADKLSKELPSKTQTLNDMYNGDPKSREQRQTYANQVK